MAGGKGSASEIFSSVLMLFPDGSVWIHLANLPQKLTSARASIVEGHLRVNGGYNEGSHSEVCRFSDAIASLAPTPLMLALKRTGAQKNGR